MRGAAAPKEVITHPDLAPAPPPKRASVNKPKAKAGRRAA
jgi:hypothetical protein